MGSTKIFKGFLKLDDWIWFLIIGGGCLLLLVILITCCCCAKRARRKGREEAMASLARQQNNNDVRVDIDRPSIPVLAPKGQSHYIPSKDGHHHHHPPQQQQQQYPVHYPNFPDPVGIYTPQKDDSSKFEYHNSESPRTTGKMRSSAINHSYPHLHHPQQQRQTAILDPQATKTIVAKSTLNERINALRYRTSEIENLDHSQNPQNPHNPQNPQKQVGQTNNAQQFSFGAQSVDVDEDNGRQRNESDSYCGSETADSYSSSADIYSGVPSSVEYGMSDCVDSLLVPSVSDSTTTTNQTSTTTANQKSTVAEYKSSAENSNHEQFEDAESSYPGSELLRVDLDRDSRVSRNSVEF